MYTRSENPFFAAERVISAIKSASAPDNLVIYCGAGVTIDRTGLGWTDLMKAIFAGDRSDEFDDEYPVKEDIDELASVMDAARFASAMTKHALDVKKTTPALQRYLTPILANQLYKSNGWQSGRLASNIANLATYSTQLGKQVTVLTTNYDIYLEQAIDKAVKTVAAVNRTVKAPALRVSVLGRQTPVRGKKLPHGLDVLDLVYLHGRVRDGGGHDGRLVISEIDYAETRQDVVSTLVDAFDDDGTAVLIFGASLTDTPLIDALAITSKRSGRLAVIPISSVGFTDREHDRAVRLTQQAARRAELLGLRVLHADFKYQVAQFCEEVLICTTHPLGPEVAMSDGERLRYGSRLCDWWDRWKGTPQHSDPSFAYRELSGAIDLLTAKIHEGVSDTKANSTRHERFRLELWVREDPSRPDRELVLWGTSSGPIMKRDILSRFPLEISSSNASVAAFTEGRPQHYDALDLEPGRKRPGRWKSFLSVPIYVDTATSRLPVGAITLASTFPKHSSAIPLRDVGQMEDLIVLIIEQGRRLLQP